jgi:hypothetical protein
MVAAEALKGRGQQLMHVDHFPNIEQVQWPPIQEGCTIVKGSGWSVAKIATDCCWRHFVDFD